MKEIEPIKEKLDEKIAKLNSSRVYKKITLDMTCHGI